MTLWLTKPLAALVEGTLSVELLDVQGGTILATRNVIGDTGDDQDHDHGHDHDHDSHGNIDPHA